MGENASGGGFRFKQNSTCVAQNAFKIIITMVNQNECVLWDSKVRHERFYCFTRLHCMIQSLCRRCFYFKN